MTGKSNSLSKNYRTTTQIAQAAFSLINSDEDLLEDDNFVKPNLIDKQGEYPIYKNFKSKNEEGSYLAQLITKNLINNYALKDIVIIARIKTQLKEFQEYLQKYNIPSSIFDNKDLDEIDEIPKFDSSMIPLTLETIEYVDFKRNTSHKFIKDSSSIGEISFYNYKYFIVFQKIHCILTINML